jgi:hypothetical protein
MTTHAFKPGDRFLINARIYDAKDEMIAIHGDTGTIVGLLDGDEPDLIADGLPGPWYAVRLDHLSVDEDVEYVDESEITGLLPDYSLN